MSQLWDRQPEEPAKAYRAFTLYRDMGPGRTLRQAAKNLQRSRSLLNEWSGKWGWVARAEAYDAAMQTMAQAAYEQGLRTEAERWARRQNEQRDSEWAMARALMEKAGAMLRFPLATARQEEDEEGRVITIVQPAKWSMADAARLVDTGAKLARLAADMAVPGGASMPQAVREEVINDADYIASVLSRLDEAGELNAADPAEDEQVRAAPTAPTAGGGAAGTG